MRIMWEQVVQCISSLMCKRGGCIWIKIFFIDRNLWRQSCCRLSFELWALNEWLPNQAWSRFCGSSRTFHQKLGIHRSEANQRPQKRGEEYFKKSVGQRRRRRPAPFPGFGDLKGTKHVLKNYSFFSFFFAWKEVSSFLNPIELFYASLAARGQWCDVPWKVARPVVTKSQRSIKKPLLSNYFKSNLNEPWNLVKFGQPEYFLLSRVYILLFNLILLGTA